VAATIFNPAQSKGHKNLKLNSVKSAYFLSSMNINGQNNSSQSFLKLDSVFLSDGIHHQPGQSSCTMLVLERVSSKIHITDFFEVVPEPNIMAHISEHNSPFPLQH